MLTAAPRRGRAEAGAPYLAACGGKAYWELRIVGADQDGFVVVGFAGTNIRTPNSEWFCLGDDESAWSLGSTGQGCMLMHGFNADSDGCVILTLCVNHCA
jgi:hypothetical protein